MGGGSSTAARRARRVRRGRQEDEDGDHPDHETGRGQALSVGGGELLRLDAGMGRAAVRVVDMSLQRQVRQFGDPEKSAMAFIAHGVGVCTVVVRYAADNVVECWDYLTGLCVWRARVHGDEASIMCRARSGAVVVGTLTGHVCWVAVDGTLCASCLPPPRPPPPPFPLLPGRHGGSLTMACRSGEVCKFDGYGGILSLLPDPTGPVIVGTCTGEVARVDEGGRIVGAVPRLEGRVGALRLAPGGGAVVAGTHTGAVARIAADGTLIGATAQLDGQITALGFAEPEPEPEPPEAEDGTAAQVEEMPVAVGTYKGVVAWVGPDGAVLGASSEMIGRVDQLAVMPDGSAVVVARPTLCTFNWSATRRRLANQKGLDTQGTEEGKVLWVRANGEAFGEALRMTGRITALELDPERGLAVVGTSDGEMAWVSKEGQIVGEVARFGGAIDAIDMTEEGAQAIWRLAF